MAYLNVRERRIETKIAYVGPELSGKATNFERLKGESARGTSSDVSFEGDLVSLEWRPHVARGFEDCDLSVRLVAAKTMSNLDTLLEDADGVVVVVDATPSARPENERAFQLVRDALARGPRAPVPVVVQLNKSDVADAVHAGSVDVDWPVVTACAARGEGVIETLEMALENVIDAMRKKNVVEAAPSTAAFDRNPLLTALREVLRETVTEHMASVEAAAAARIAERAALPLDELRQVAAELKKTLAISGRETARALAAQEAAITDVSLRVAELQARVLELATRPDILAVETRLRDETAARVRADRDHLTSIGAVIKRTVEALATDVKKLETSSKQTQLAADVAALHAKIDGLATSTRVPERIGALETTLQRELRERVGPELARIHDAMRLMQTDTGEALLRADARASHIEGGVTELLEELKKRKKGWFS